MGGETLRLLPAEPGQRRQDTRRLQREYMSLTVRAGAVYSLPGGKVDRGGAGAVGPEYAFFQIVRTRVGRQKTGTGKKEEGSATLVSLQRLLGWRREGDAAEGAGEYLLSYDGDSEVLDLLLW